MATRLQKSMLQPITVIFKFLTSKTRVVIWLYEQPATRIEGRLLGFGASPFGQRCGKVPAGSGAGSRECGAGRAATAATVAACGGGCGGGVGGCSCSGCGGYGCGGCGCFDGSGGCGSCGGGRGSSFRWCGSGGGSGGIRGCSFCCLALRLPPRPFAGAAAGPFLAAGAVILTFPPPLSPCPLSLRSPQMSS